MHLIKVGTWGEPANGTIPLGNLDPYFTFNVSETFFDMSTKSFLSHTWFLFVCLSLNYSENLAEAAVER